jgi:hypothetical protein
VSEAPCGLSKGTTTAKRVTPGIEGLSEHRNAVLTGQVR